MQRKKDKFADDVDLIIKERAEKYGSTIYTKHQLLNDVFQDRDIRQVFDWLDKKCPELKVNLLIKKVIKKRIDIFLKQKDGSGIQ